VFSQELGCGFSVIPEAQIKHGCGCGYHLRTDEGLRTLFQAGLNSSDNPRMYLNGELVAVQATSTNADNHYSKKGDEFSETYSFDSTIIRFDNSVSSACPGGSEGCEVIVFDTTMTVSTGSCTVEVKKLIGDCGC
jgi:hypothetical protein